MKKIKLRVGRYTFWKKKSVYLFIEPEEKYDLISKEFVPLWFEDVQDSGRQPNEIYKNDLKNLHFADLANGHNRGDKVGLQYLCNTNSANQFDFGVAVNNNFGSISSRQGDPQKASGNTLSFPAINPFTHFNNEGPLIDYYYGTGANEEPINYTSNTVDKLIGSNNLCPSQIPSNESGGLTDIESENIKQEFISSTDSIRRIYLANMLTREYLTDSIHFDIDSARYWMGNIKGLTARFQVVDSWLQVEETDSAQLYLNNIPNLVAFIEDDSIEYSHFSSLKNLQIAAIQNGTSDAQLVNNNLSTLIQIADAGNFYASIQAQNLLNEVNGFTYIKKVHFPSNGGEQDLTAPSIKLQTLVEPMKDGPSLIAVPNPAKTSTIFHYRLLEGMETGKILISSLDGRLVGEIFLESKNGQVTWNFGNVNNGLYVSRLMHEGEIVQSVRLYISR